jgi:alcohol dehydrogenase class IV
MNSNQIRQRLIHRVVDLKRQVGLTQKLAATGVSLTDIPMLSEHAISDPCILTNPRRSSKRDVEVVYEEAL